MLSEFLQDSEDGPFDNKEKCREQQWLCNSILSNMKEDENGKKARGHLEEVGLSLDYVQTHPNLERSDIFDDYRRHEFDPTVAMNKTK